MDQEQEFTKDEIRFYRKIVDGKEMEVAILQDAAEEGVIASESMEVIFGIAKAAVEDGRAATIQKFENMYTLKIADFIPDDDEKEV